RDELRPLWRAIDAARAFELDGAVADFDRQGDPRIAIPLAAGALAKESGPPLESRADVANRPRRGPDREAAGRGRPRVDVDAAALELDRSRVHERRDPVCVDPELAAVDQGHGGARGGIRADVRTGGERLANRGDRGTAA